MISAVEQRFYQGVIDNLDQEWIPDIYYTLLPGAEKATYAISKELVAIAEPYLGEVMSEKARRAIQEKVDRVVDDHTMRREILIWVTLMGEPLFIEELRVIQDSDTSYRIAPYMERTVFFTVDREKQQWSNELSKTKPTDGSPSEKWEIRRTRISDSMK